MIGCQGVDISTCKVIAKSPYIFTCYIQPHSHYIFLQEKKAEKLNTNLLVANISSGKEVVCNYR